MTTDIRNISPSFAFNLPSHPPVTKVARASFEKQVDSWAVIGEDLFTYAAVVPKTVAKFVIGEQAAEPALNAHTTFAYNEGVVGNALVTVQKVLAEAGAIIGAIAGVLIAGGKTVVGANTTGTIAAHADNGKAVAAVAATLATSFVSAPLKWLRLTVVEALKILPAVGTVVGGAAGTAIGAITGVLQGLSYLLGIAAEKTADAAPSAPAGSGTAVDSTVTP